MARVRAVENRRWLLRVTNSVSRPLSILTEEYTKQFRGMCAGAVDLPYNFRTDTTLYTRFGDWFAWDVRASFRLFCYYKLFGKRT